MQRVHKFCAKFNPISRWGGAFVDAFDWVRLVGLKMEEAFTKIWQHVAHMKAASISIFLGLNVIKSSFIENALAKGKKA